MPTWDSLELKASFIPQFTHYALSLTLSRRRGNFISLAPWGEGERGAVNYFQPVMKDAFS